MTETLVTSKLPPQNKEAERSALGAMLIEENALSLGLEHLRIQSFYDDAHQKIFQAMVTLYKEHRPVDVVTLTDALRKAGDLDLIGGPSVIASLSLYVPTAANISSYIKMIKEKEILRILITHATKICADSYHPNASAEYILEQAQKSVYELATRHVDTKATSMKELARQAIETIEHLYQNKGYITGIGTGFHELDKLTSGFQKSDLIIIAGRPSMGKSAFMCCVAEHMVVKEKVPTLIFSLEMSKEHLVQRMLCAYARVNAQNVRTGFLSDRDWPLLTNAAGKLSESPLYIDDSPGISMMEIRAKARRLQSQYGIGCIILDYLQLIQGSLHSENRQQEISEISRSLKSLARELDVPLIAVSQLSRAPEKRDDNRPRLSDLRESGAIEQDADVVLLLFREEYYKPEEESLKGVAEVIIAKQRNGPVGTVKMTFLRDFTRFENLSVRPSEEMNP